MRQIVSVYDKKLMQFMGLYLVATLSVAVRQFGDSMQKDEVVRAHPEDFSLMKVGDFVEETGEIIPCTPSLVVEAEKLFPRPKDIELSHETGQIDIEDVINGQRKYGDA